MSKKVFVSVTHADCLLKELHLQYKEGKNCDLEIRLKGKRLFVHKCLIDIFFLKIGAEIEDDRFYIDLEEYSPYVIEALIEFVYTGTLICPLNKIKVVYIAAATLGCVDAQKGCQTYLQNTGVLPVASDKEFVTFHEGRLSEPEACTSESEHEPLDTVDTSAEPPRVKVEVCNEESEYQPTDLSNIGENLESSSIPYSHDYSGTSEQLSIEENVSTITKPPLNFPTYPDVSKELNHNPVTIAVPVGMHSTPDDLKQIEKRVGRSKKLVDPSYDAVNTANKRKADSQSSVSTETEESSTKRGRRCEAPGTVVEYVYPKQPVIFGGNLYLKKKSLSLVKPLETGQEQTNTSKTISSSSGKKATGKQAGKEVIDGLKTMIQAGNEKKYKKPSPKKWVVKCNKNLEASQKAGKSVIDGLRVRLKTPSDRSPKQSKKLNTSNDTATSSGKLTMKSTIAEWLVHKLDKTKSGECSISEPEKTKAHTTCSVTTDNDIKDTGETSAQKLSDTSSGIKTEADDQGSDAEKNEQMSFLGLTKTVDRDKRRLEEKESEESMKNTRRLRSRKKVDYCKFENDDIEDSEDTVKCSVSPTTCEKVNNKKKNASTDIDDHKISGKQSQVGNKKVNATMKAVVPISEKVGSNKTHSSRVELKDYDLEDKMYFPAAGTVPLGEATRSHYVQGGYMKARFLTESIEDKDGNVTVISKRVPVRPRQFGVDERCKNRPAVYICHPTAPVVNPASKAPKNTKNYQVLAKSQSQSAYNYRLKKI